MKRIIDFFLSFVASLILFPLLLPICVILKLTGEGEIFYMQERVGRYGKNFKLLKFATMLKNSPNIGAKEITLKNDTRVLPFGKFLRKSKINELPQLWNVINGDMSIIGPRPMVPNTYQFYSKEARSLLNTIRPGLSGIGSIFFRDEESFLENKTDPQNFYINIIIPYKSELETWYVKNNSLINYFKCIIVTALIILFPRSNIIDYFFNDIPLKPTELTK